MIRRIGYGLLTGLLLSGCGGGGSDSSAPASGGGSGISNNAPVALVGADQNVKVGDTVTLDGSASRDHDGDTLSYHWEITTLPESSAATLTEVSTPKPRFPADAAGRYVVTLVVNDGQADSEAASVEVVAAVQNSAPVADAGPDQNVATGTAVQLDGRDSSDADGDTLTYQWSFTNRPASSTADLREADTVQPFFTPDQDGEYRFALVVNDGLVDSSADEVVIMATTANSAPVADAGIEQDVLEGTAVALNGAGSSDADGDPLTYQWSFVSRPPGSSAELNQDDTVSPTFNADVEGTFVIELLVGDGEADSAADRVSVTVTKANVKPVADAGADQSVVEGDLVTLDASGSSDPEGDSLTYWWRFVSVPTDSTAALSDAVGAAPKFSADLEGFYVLALVVSDGELDSTEDRVIVSASEANAAPSADAGRNFNALTGTAVTLNGSFSTDANGDPLSFEWTLISRPAGSAAALVNPSTHAPSLTPDLDGSYVLELTVNDGVLSDTDRVIVVAETVNSAPVAHAGDDQTIYTGNTADLDGSASSDANGDSLTYQWSFVSEPDGSAAILVNSSSAWAEFIPHVAGDYVLKLIVNDGEASSTQDTVQITALAPDIALEQYDAGGAFDPPSWRSVGLPYSSNTSIDRACTGTCGPIELARFRLEAQGRSYTLRNVQVTKVDGGPLPAGLNARFSGISSGQTIEADETLSFSLLVEHVDASVQVEFAFLVNETGDAFSSRYTLNLR